MCMTIATTFSVAWLPYQLNRIVMAYGSSDQVELALLIYNPSATLSYINSCINPIVYGLMWRPFRLSLIEVTASCFMYEVQAILHFEVPVLYSMEFIPWKKFHGNHSILISMGDDVFHGNSMVIPCG